MVGQEKTIEDRPPDPTPCPLCGGARAVIRNSHDTEHLGYRVWYTVYHPDKECLSNRLTSLERKIDAILSSLEAE